MRNSGEIAADAYVNRLALFQGGGDGLVNLFMRIFQIIHNSLKQINHTNKNIYIKN